MMEDAGDPVHCEEATKHAHWQDVLKAGIQSIEANNTWELAKLLAGAKQIEVKWIYKLKLK